MKKWKKTKKLLSLFLCAAMRSGLTACGNSDSQTKQSKPAEQEKTSESKDSTKGTQSESSKAEDNMMDFLDNF